jgi:hypothetical protein
MMETPITCRGTQLHKLFKDAQFRSGNDKKHTNDCTRKMHFLQDSNNKRAGHCKIFLPAVHKTGNNKVRKMQAPRSKIHLFAMQF